LTVGIRALVGAGIMGVGPLTEASGSFAEVAQPTARVRDTTRQ
jgi:hypothetical protein